MNWKTDFRSFYYEFAPHPQDIVLAPAQTVILIVDIQNVYLQPSEDEHEAARWQPFYQRMNEQVIPTTAAIIADARARSVEVIYARIACLKQDGRDRSLSQKKPGFNYLLMPQNTWQSQIVDALKPAADDIVVTKTTDSALTGTNLRLILANMGIRHVIVAGIFTDQCISSTVRSLADESFDVVVLEDCCAAATDDIHRSALESINMIYCQVVNSADLPGFYQAE